MSERAGRVVVLVVDGDQARAQRATAAQRAQQGDDLRSLVGEGLRHEGVDGLLVTVSLGADLHVPTVGVARPTGKRCETSLSQVRH